VGVALEEVSNEGAKRHILPDSLETSHLSQTPKGSEQVTEDETEHQAASLPATSSPLEDTRAKGVNGLVYEELPSPLLKDGHNVAKGMNIHGTAKFFKEPAFSIGRNGCGSKFPIIP
jgi:hypothetical protein